MLFLGADGEPAALRGPLLPSHRQAVEGLVQRRATSSAAITAGPTTATASWSMIPQFPCEQPRAGRHAPNPFAAKRATAMSGSPRRAAAPILRRPRGARSGLSPHPPVLRPLEHVVAPADGELVRQRAFRLRPQGHVRRHQPAEAREIRDHRDRLRLRRRDRSSPSSTRRSPHASPAPPSRPPSAHAQPLVSCRSAAGSTWSIRPASGTSSSIARRRSTTARSSSCKCSTETTREEDCSSAGADRLGRGDHRGGPRHAGGDRSRRDRRHEPQDRAPYADPTGPE